jgi:hypothetical protein
METFFCVDLFGFIYSGVEWGWGVKFGLFVLFCLFVLFVYSFVFFYRITRRAKIEKQELIF